VAEISKRQANTPPGDCCGKWQVASGVAKSRVRGIVRRCDGTGP